MSNKKKLKNCGGILRLRLRLVRVKVFPENRYFPKMLFSGKENILMCLVAFQKMFRKIFSDVWLYSWKYHRKHIFYLLLTFSHIFSVTKRIHNIIHFSKHKQNPEKNHQIWTNEGKIAIREIAISIGEIAIEEIAISIADQRQSARCLDRSLSLSRCVCSLSVFCCVLAVCFSLLRVLKWFLGQQV